MNTLDVAWLGGLIEGEGAFMWGGTSPEIALQLTDHDTLRKAASLFGVGVQAPWTPKGKPTYKPVLTCRIYGSRAVSWMLTLYTFLGARRRAKVAELVRRWNAAPNVPKAPRGQRWMATCHPDHMRKGRGLCGACYMREWRAKRKAAA